MTERAAVRGVDADASPAVTVHALLRGIVDYAGLFPPASLPLAVAIAEYAEHRNGPHAWALGRFVVPAARLEEFEGAAADAMPRQAARSWALSALLGSDLEEDIARIERFNERHGDARAGAVMVDTVELKAHSPREVARAGELLDRQFDTFMELPVGDDPGDLIAAIAGTTAKAKIRTGGVTTDAIPAAAHVVRFIARCVEHRVAFKATAGLHHPWRAEYRLTQAEDAPTATMYGFLNVVLAATALRAGWSVAASATLLEERDPGTIRFGGDGVVWRGRRLTLEEIGRGRESLTAFGSCSFSEPIEGLRSSGLL